MACKKPLSVSGLAMTDDDDENSVKKLMGGRNQEGMGRDDKNGRSSAGLGRARKVW